MFYKSCVQKLQNRSATSKSKTSSKSEAPGRVWSLRRARKPNYEQRGTNQAGGRIRLEATDDTRNEGSVLRVERALNARAMRECDTPRRARAPLPTLLCALLLGVRRVAGGRRDGFSKLTFFFADVPYTFLCVTSDDLVSYGSVCGVSEPVVEVSAGRTVVLRPVHCCLQSISRYSEAELQYQLLCSYPLVVPAFGRRGFGDGDGEVRGGSQQLLGSGRRQLRALSLCGACCENGQVLLVLLRVEQRLLFDHLHLESCTHWQHRSLGNSGSGAQLPRQVRQQTVDSRLG